MGSLARPTRKDKLRLLTINWVKKTANAYLKDTTTGSSSVIVELICVYWITEFEKSLFVHFVGCVM